MAEAPCPRLAFPLDVASLGEARRLIAMLRPHAGVFKVGLELFSAAGPDAVRAVHDAGATCFLDLKLHDIPATMARAVEAVVQLGVGYLTLHAVAGGAALRGAATVAAGSATRLLAVTVLTSMDEAGLDEIGVTAVPSAWVTHLVRLSLACGVHGFVTSPWECAALRAEAGPGACIVTPGVRPAGAAHDDQRRVATPSEAIRSGADLLVVGRPIRNAADPARAAADVAREIAEATTGPAV